MYTVKQIFSDTFQVANFDSDYRYPIATYRIQGKRCSCPARNPCKHQDIIRSFKELEPGAWAFEFIGKQIQPIALHLFEVT
jgi:hypothetical protein